VHEILRMKKFYSENQLIRKTIRLTSLIGTNYPESYKLLDETPLFLGQETDKKTSGPNWKITWIHLNILRCIFADHRLRIFFPNM
jgi:hypothetical protein